MNNKKKLADWVFVHLGDDNGGNPSPPGSNCRLVFGQPDDDGLPMHVATTYNNEGFEVWLGYRNGGWNVFYGMPYARQLAWFILWDWWAKSTWFGLKRKIWYWALGVQVDAMKKWRNPEERRKPE